MSDPADILSRPETLAEVNKSVVRELPKLKKLVEGRDIWDEVYPEHKGHDLRALPTIDTSIRAVCLDCLPEGWQVGDDFEVLRITHVQYVTIQRRRHLRARRGRREEKLGARRVSTKKVQKDNTNG